MAQVTPFPLVAQLQADIDNSDFLSTDIPGPHEVPRPPKLSVAADLREETREWVLEKAVSAEGVLSCRCASLSLLHTVRAAV